MQAAFHGTPAGYAEYRKKFSDSGVIFKKSESFSL